jgi:AcrR family transcriptional regulator
MNTVNNKRKKESIEKIEKVFIQFIQTKEINEISVSDICKEAHINRSTFYANFIDIYDLVDKLRNKMVLDYASIFKDNTDGHTPENYLKMFKHIKENQIFYRTYFKLNYDKYPIPEYYYDIEFAKKWHRDKLIEYHVEFFKAGITALIKKWLYNGCKESPEEIVEVLVSEYIT